MDKKNFIALAFGSFSLLQLFNCPGAKAEVAVCFSQPPNVVPIPCLADPSGALIVGIVSPGIGAPVYPTGVGPTLLAAGVSQSFQIASAPTYHTCTIVNYSTAALQGIAAVESIFIDEVSTASVGTPSIEVTPGGTFYSHRMTGRISWNAATIGHTIGGTCVNG